MLKTLSKLFIFFLLVIISQGIFAQSGPGDPGDGVDPDIPIDGGVSLLLIAGAAYGTKKIVGRKKNSKEENIDL